MEDPNNYWNYNTFGYSELSYSNSGSDLWKWLPEPSRYDLKAHKKYYLWYLQWLLDHFGTYPKLEDKQVDIRKDIFIRKPLCRSPPL